MQVSLQYAEEHLADLLQAADKEEVVIERPGKPSIMLVPSPEPPQPKPTRIPLRELLGVGEGLVHVPDEEEWRAIKKAMLADMPDFTPLKNGKA